MLKWHITLKDKGTIKSILLSRIDLLNKAFETEDPSRLGKCRYLETGCQYRNEKVCSCAELEPLNIAPLQRSLEISYDDDFIQRLINAKAVSETSDFFCLTTRDIIAPRKHYMETISGLESTYNNDEIDEFKACLWVSLRTLKNRLNINLDGTEQQSIVQSLADCRVRIGFRWIKLKSSIHPEGEIVPYIQNVSLTNEMKFTKPSQYHLAELGIICAMYGKSKGLMV